MIMVFVILFFAIAYSCTAQITRFSKYEDRTDIVSLYPEYPLYFLYKKDTIFLSIFMDSLAPKYRPCYLYAFYPKTVKSFDISFGLINGVPQKFTATVVDSITDKNQTYVEYRISGSTADILFYDYTYVAFDGIKQFMIMDERTDYFESFYRDANK